MEKGFSCRLQYNTEISKIRKYFEKADTLTIIAGEAGLGFTAITPQQDCYYVAQIHDCDILKLYVNREASDVWKYGGIVKNISAAVFNKFMDGKEVNAAIVFDIDKDAVSLTMSIMNANNVIRSEVLPLTDVSKVYKQPVHRNANIELPVNEFKKLCATLSSNIGDIKIQAQTDALKIIPSQGEPSTYGFWSDTATTKTCYVKPLVFSRAAKVNIGNAKTQLAGVYSPMDSDDFLLKIKLGIVLFAVYSRSTI